VQLHERGCHAAQLAVISQDLWFSQMKSTHLVDYVALDLDPMPSVPFEQVVQVALQCRDVVETSSRHRRDIEDPTWTKTSRARDYMCISPCLPTQRMRPGACFVK
jgi:DNA primase